MSFKGFVQTPLWKTPTGNRVEAEHSSMSPVMSCTWNDSCQKVRRASLSAWELATQTAEVCTDSLVDSCVITDMHVSGLDQRQDVVHIDLASQAPANCSLKTQPLLRFLPQAHVESDKAPACMAGKLSREGE